MSRRQHVLNKSFGLKNSKNALISKFHLNEKKYKKNC